MLHPNTACDATEYDERSRRADPFSQISPMHPRDYKRRSVHLASAADIKRSSEPTGRDMRIDERLQDLVAERIRVNLADKGITVEDFIDLGWELEQSVYAQKRNWSRAVKAILGLGAPYDYQEHAVREGLQVMMRACDKVAAL